jgi:hypothetical protein
MPTTISKSPRPARKNNVSAGKGPLDIPSLCPTGNHCWQDFLCFFAAAERRLRHSGDAVAHKRAINQEQQFARQYSVPALQPG